jgi:UDP-2,3-diacylglucosamine pyrophosphatase LpxH
VRVAIIAVGFQANTARGVSMAKTYIETIKGNKRSPNLSYHTLILGDVHLGLSICRIDALIEFIKRSKARQIYLQGDTFNSVNPQLSEKHRAFLKLLLELEKAGVAIIWGAVNHDPNLNELLNRFFRTGCEVKRERTLSINNRKFLVMHGDRFDRVIQNLPDWLIKGATWIYEAIAHIEPDQWSMARWLKSLAKNQLTQVVSILEQEGLLAATIAECDAIVCGHTHQLAHAKSASEQGIIHYYNAGDWTQRRCGAVGITDKGKVDLLRIHTWRKPHKA